MIHQQLRPVTGGPIDGDRPHLNDAQLVFLRHSVVRLLRAETELAARTYQRVWPGPGGDHLEMAQALRSALSKLDRKVYGRCERCGAGIPYARLKATPYVRCCGGCQLDRI